jgi:adenine-specific DNA-methyltransferase
MATSEKKSVETLTHEDARRKNIPTAELSSVMREEEQNPIRVAYERRNRDLDPQLVWRGKDEQDWSDLVVQAPPLYIQEKVHPKVLIDDLRRQSEADTKAADAQLNLFADFNGVPDGNAKTEFYQHDANWTNRMILGDSLQVMASMAEREGLRGHVQCIYFDPPYGIKFNSNFQWSTTSRDVKDGNIDHITREPEQVKAFRDTWRDGIHSYLTYLRDRLIVARDLLTDSGSIFVQIGDENVHRVRAVMDEVFGEENHNSLITFTKAEGLSDKSFSNVTDFILWYSKCKTSMKYRALKSIKTPGEAGATGYILLEDEERTHWRAATTEEINSGHIKGYTFFDDQPLISQDEMEGGQEPFFFQGKQYFPAKGRHWSTGKDLSKLERIARANRMIQRGNRIEWKRYITEVAGTPLNNVWSGMGDRGFAGGNKVYVVQTAPEVIKRCILMCSDPGDLILDPTCGSGTTAYVAEQWGRRWITIDTSRVALALSRARIMGARYPYYLLADSREGQKKEAEITQTIEPTQPTYNNIRQGFVYERLPHITLGSIANNLEIDIIWSNHQEILEPLCQKLNTALSKNWEEWEIPREADDTWSESSKALHGQLWQQRIARQKEIDVSIAAKAEYEYLYDKPYEYKKTVRVAGPFTVESLSPHRVLGVDENDDLIDGVSETNAGYGEGWDFVRVILENLKTSGVQQANKGDRITFTSLMPWPGDLVCAEGRYLEGNIESGTEKRAAVFIGPEFGTVSRPDLVQAAREAGDANFDVLVACAFNYEAHATEFSKLGRIPVLKARMNADLHMADNLKNTGKGNLFVIFGEPDIDILSEENGQYSVKVNGVDIFNPQTGEVRSDNADGIACWFIDTDYNEESFFVRHAYFLGANDPYKALKTTLKAEIKEEVWESLYSDTSRPFDKPQSGRIAVKVINHLGDEVMKVFKI